MGIHADPNTDIIVRSDTCGRVRYTDQYKHDVLTAFDAGSLGAPGFALQCGIKYPTFAA